MAILMNENLREETKITTLVDYEEGLHMAEIQFISQVVAAARHHLSPCGMFMQTSGQRGSQLGSADSSQSGVKSIDLALTLGLLNFFPSSSLQNARGAAGYSSVVDQCGNHSACLSTCLKG